MGAVPRDPVQLERSAGELGGRALERVLRGADFRDVLRGARQAHGAPLLVADDLRAAVEPPDAAVGPDHAVLEIDRRAALDGVAHRGIDAVAIVGCTRSEPGSYRPGKRARSRP